MKNKILILLSMVSLVGCATDYKQAMPVLGGYRDTKIADDLYRVQFDANEYTNEEREADFAMLRAADVTLQHGYSYFAVVKEDPFTKLDIETRVGGPDATGQNVKYPERTQYHSDHRIFATRRKEGFLIRTFKEEPDIKGKIFDAASLSRVIREKYKLDHKK
jgi:hypothetical protein